MRGDVDHLLIGTSLPFLLAPGLHHLEAFNEAVAGVPGATGATKVGERLRQAVDLEHWAAFQEGFRGCREWPLEVAGAAGPAPATVTFLSGDVHHSYVAEAPTRREAGTSPTAAASCRRSAHRSATRCRRACGS